MTTIPPSARPNIAPSEDRVKELQGWLAHDEVIPGDILDDLLAILDDYSVLKAEVKRLNTWHSTLSEAWKDRAEKAEAQLAKQAPLIEAVMGANLFPAPTDGRTCIDSHDKIIRAALALREGEGK